MDSRAFEELKEAYVLGALPEDERADFEAYLARHPDRQAEIEDLGGLAGLLALVPPEHEPPADLRDRVMGVVESESEAGSSRPRAARRGRSPRSGGLADLRNVALGVAAVLLVGLVSWNVLLRGDVQDLRGQVEEARAAGRAQETTEIRLGGSWAQQGARAEVTALGDGRAILIVEDMPSLPEDRTLQVWVIEGETPEPSGLLQPAGGTGATPVTSPLEGADTIAVTVEPPGGSDAPTTDPVLLKDLKEL